MKDEVINRLENNLRLIHIFIKQIKKEVKKMGAVGDAIAGFANAINSALDEIVLDIEGLQARIEELIASGGTPEEVAALLQPLLDKANAIKGIVP